MTPIWFITGCSSGFGRTLVERVLQRGWKVVATARNPASLQEFATQYPHHILPLQMDVTRPEEIEAVVQQAVQTWERLDVVVNNAGYGLVGALEELTEEQIRANFETNLFGPIHVMRAVLPTLRKQRSGHILNLTAIAGFCNEMGFSAYGASKFALEGASEAVRSEVAPLGIKVTIIEPGPFRTDFIGRSLEKAPTTIPDYDGTSGKFYRLLQSINGKQLGDPVKAAEAMIQITQVPNPPLRLPLGKYAYKKFRDKLANLTKELDAFENIGMPTDF